MGGQSAALRRSCPVEFVKPDCRKRGWSALPCRVRQSDYRKGGWPALPGRVRQIHLPKACVASLLLFIGPVRSSSSNQIAENEGGQSAALHRSCPVEFIKPYCLKRGWPVCCSPNRYRKRSWPACCSSPALPGQVRRSSLPRARGANLLLFFAFARSSPSTQAVRSLPAGVLHMGFKASLHPPSHLTRMHGC